MCVCVWSIMFKLHLDDFMFMMCVFACVRIVSLWDLSPRLKQ